MLTKVLLLINIFLLSATCFDLSRNRLEILDALKRTFDFLSEKPTLNIDGVLGVVIAAGMLSKTSRETIDLIEKENVTKLAEKALMIVETILPTLSRNQYKYELFNDYMTDPKLYQRNITFRYGELDLHDVNINTTYDLHSPEEFTKYIWNSTFSEQIFDECLVEVLEQTKTMSPQVCSISKKCLDYLVDHEINEADRGYGAPHRLLYINVARARNCIMKDDVYNSLAQYLCNYIYWEAKRAYLLGVTYKNVDLLMEQIYMCGYEGFAEFFSEDWLQTILSVQDVHGCFHPKIQTMRAKREGNIISYGCHDHTTGLGSASLSMYYYFIFKSQ